MDGFELARRFREHPRLCRTRLVAVTGYGQPRDRERTREAGFSRHLVKPLDLVALRELVEEDTREAHEDPA
jgi:CheY-like chemotaxis protein